MCQEDIVVVSQCHHLGPVQCTAAANHCFYIHLSLNSAKTTHDSRPVVVVLIKCSQHCIIMTKSSSFLSFEKLLDIFFFTFATSMHHILHVYKILVLLLLGQCIL